VSIRKRWYVPRAVSYDLYRDRYESDLDRAVGFTGKPHGFFTEAKAVELLRLARRHLGDPNRVEALDVGCGIGLTDRYLEGRLGSLTGVDVSPGVLERAEQTNPWARYVLYDGERLPFDDGTFDLTFAVCVVQVIEPSKRPRFVSELARVTRSGGLAVAFEHNPINPLTRLVVRRCSFGDDAQMLGPGHLASLFQLANLPIVERGYILLFPTSGEPLRKLERRLARLPLGAQYYLAGRGPGTHST
jgi:SAM-dependent methyltransferase